MSTIELATSRKLRVENVRAKLQSLKNLSKGDQDSLLAIQRSLAQHNAIDDPQTTQPEFGKKDEQDIMIEGRLWHYFQSKAEQYNDKIQREKVNGWHRIIKTVLTETDKKIKANEGHIEQMESMIKSKYKQTHSLFKEIQSIKLQKSQEKEQRASRRKRSNVETSRGQKVSIIQQNIAGIKEEIESRTEENQKIKVELKKLKEQRINLLVNLMKNGYYLNDGVKHFLQKMIEIGYRPTIKDFPQFLDIRSKQYLLLEYEQLIRKMQQVNRSTFKSKEQRARAKSNIQLSGLAKQEQFKDIYNGTKDYLMKLLLKEDWKKQETRLPKIGFKNDSQMADRRREAQKKRIKIAYPEELREKVKKIQFGIKLDTILP